jgi:hypothetical protein
MTEANLPVSLRHTEPRDIKGIVELCQRVYPDTPPWRPARLRARGGSLQRRHQHHRRPCHG